jgi:DsbC/DsbD-like thiol-disulfide interchange protein
MLRTTRTISAFFVAAALCGASAHAEEKLYEIKKTDAKVAVGGKATTSVTIATKNGWHVNGEAPITLSLTPPAGITLPKTKLARADLAASTQESARFDVAFEAAEPGSKVIAAEARFVICQETACKPVKETLSLTVDVSAAAPAKDKAAKKSKKKA